MYKKTLFIENKFLPNFYFNSLTLHHCKRIFIVQNKCKKNQLSAFSTTPPFLLTLTHFWEQLNIRRCEIWLT